MSLQIFGAGLAGLLAGAMDRHAMIYEAQPVLPHNHHAVLRFRDDKISRALDIPFRRVKVLKSIWEAGREHAVVTPRLANLYSRKVTGMALDRSVLNLEPAVRYIAPPDLVARLGELCDGRINFAHPIDRAELQSLRRSGPILSTIPLPDMLRILDIPHHHSQFRAVDISVSKYRVVGADVFQTIYFPSSNFPVYRASITGEELIIEGATGAGVAGELVLTEVLDAFGLRREDVSHVVNARQGLGKIVPLPAEERRAILRALTRDHGIFSMGRYACWRQILLDDVLEDYRKIRAMMALDGYDQLRSVV